MKVLGIHGTFTLHHHDPSIAYIENGEVVSAFEEERFWKIKGGKGLLPIKSIEKLLGEEDLRIEEIDLVAVPYSSHTNVIERTEEFLKHYFGYSPKIEAVNHQLAHLASAYYSTNWDECMCLSYDGFGDGLSAMYGVCKNGEIEVLGKIERDQSLGMFYAAITSFLGFTPNEDEFKVMGLASYGVSGIDFSNFVQIKENGYKMSRPFLRTNPPIQTSLENFYSRELVSYLGNPRRCGEKLTQSHKNIARGAQRILEDAATSLIRRIHELTGVRRLALAGGVALNCTLNRVINSLPFIDEVFIQPAASDRGLSLGCAQYVCNKHFRRPYPISNYYLGPKTSLKSLDSDVRLTQWNSLEPEDPCKIAANLISEGKIIGWMNGRSEFGPRALGNRSILADPRNPDMKDIVNKKIKFREEFRPFAPAVLEERASDIFDVDCPHPFMTIAVRVKEDWRDKIPSVTHVDGSARIQTVSEKSNPYFHQLILEFEKKTGVPVVLNTSFNVKGMPIVETPMDALSTFASTGMDALFIQNRFFAKSHSIN